MISSSLIIKGNFSIFMESGKRKKQLKFRLEGLKLERKKNQIRQHFSKDTVTVLFGK